MSLNVKVKVPVAVTGNKINQQNRVWVEELPQVEDKIQGPLYDLDQQALEEAREEAFQQCTIMGWLEMEYYLQALAFGQLERDGLLERYNLQPYGRFGGWCGLGLGSNVNIGQPQNGQPLQDPNLNDPPGSRLGLDYFMRRDRQPARPAEEPNRAGPPFDDLQSGLAGNHQRSPEMSGANENAADNFSHNGLKNDKVLDFTGLQAFRIPELRQFPKVSRRKSQG
jgi:hypothetical protein